MNKMAKATKLLEQYEREANARHAEALAQIAEARKAIEAQEPVEKKPLLPETIRRVEMIISNGADMKDAAAWQAYAEAFNTLLDLRRQPGSEPAKSLTKQWLIDSKGFVQYVFNTEWKLQQLCPMFDSEASAIAALEAVGCNRIKKMMNTLHGRGYD